MLAENGGRLFVLSNDELYLDENGEGDWTLDNSLGQITARGGGIEPSIVSFGSYYGDYGQQRIIGGTISAEDGGSVAFTGQTSLADLTVSATNSSAVRGYYPDFGLGEGGLYNARFARVTFETDETSFVELSTQEEYGQQLLLQDVTFAGNVSLAIGSFGVLGSLTNSGSLYLGASAGLCRGYCDTFDVAL